MKILNRKEIDKFTRRHANAKKPFSKWLKAVKEATWKKHSDIKNTFNSADRVGQAYIFNVGGNNFRAVCVVEFKDGVVHIKKVMTHEQYDKWNK